MPKPKTVLLVEDRAEEAHLLMEAFLERARESASFDFRVEIASSPEDYLSRHQDKKYDVYVVDLRMDEDTPIHHQDFLLFGYLIVETQAIEFPDALIMVFSAHSEHERILRAMRRGADDFVPKHQGISVLIDRVERRLHEREAQDRAIKAAEEFLASKRPEPSPDGTGRFLALANGEAVERGNSRFEALYKYRERCRLSAELPLDPIIVVVS
jgi:DNA-binding NarL/FixJ family response regulator